MAQCLGFLGENQSKIVLLELDVDQRCVVHAFLKPLPATAIRVTGGDFVAFFFQNHAVCGKDRGFVFHDKNGWSKRSGQSGTLETYGLAEISLLD